jgi:membrane protein YqaA with SNARE-associated domain
MIKVAGGPHAEKALAVISFAEASFFPIPPDVMLVPMVLARPDRAWRYAFVCAAASIMGGALGYYIGFSLEAVGVAVLRFFHSYQGLDVYRATFAKYGFWFVLGQGILPIPYKLTTIASGLAHFSFGLFMLASCITRNCRFFFVAYISKRFGPEIVAIVEKRLLLVGSVVLVAIVLAILALKLLGHH